MRRNLHIPYILLACLLAVSCIEEFNARLSDKDENLLVVSGSIRSDDQCTFYLSRTRGLNDTNYSSDLMEDNARVSVFGDDGQRFDGRLIDRGAYRVYVGTLSPNHNYWLHIVTADGLIFTSTPQMPLYADSIDALTFEQREDDWRVEVQLSSPAPEGEVKYYRWDFDEYWEVITPYKADFEFNPLTLQIDSARPPKNHGWAHSTSREAVMCSTADYVEGRIFRKTLYTMEHTDDRIARLYFTRVKQRSISREEYEYEMFRRKLSNEMGGLFTPMPAELPTNLHCENGQTRVIGFVGVSGKPSQAEMFIKNSEVYHRSTRISRDLTPEEIEGWSFPALYRFNYRIHQYEQMIGEASITWTYRWCVDCTDPVWGASLECPPFWPGYVPPVLPPL